eukprot:CAMPEP_0175904336 /NCGR_PEP_ID=MMETSP0108-20121206/4417_1 /TAXON_ID=195067 ORGANISM="Goniomonas pacifica, Strain CCMP1869" /NCGR_SAMPLE_ID=MMETSP0108 /ASSEMBLY_ACC=CAM_ASM_000204 /LENGTH=132 /DNA_ID=CAMNT_0017226131 /DNA_START=37 /DNA_END=436 /DNA_ORIENTATION=-
MREALAGGSAGAGGAAAGGAVALHGPAEAGGRVAVAAVLGRAHAHDLGVDCAADAVLELHVELRQSIHIQNAGVTDVALSSLLDDVANLESLHRLVLGDAATAVRAADDSRMSTALRTHCVASVTALLCHTR